MILETIKELLPNRDYTYYGTLDQVAESIFLGYRKAGHMSSYKFSKLSRELFPSKPKGRKLHSYLLYTNGYKYCRACDTVYTIDLFRKNSCKPDSLQDHCVTCHQEGTSRTQAARQAKYRAAKLSATPKWADLQDISRFYLNTPEGCSVDHIVPLQGELVCGLHILDNLQYLTKEENSSKGNKFT